MSKWIKRGIAAVIVLGLAAGLAGFTYLTRDMNYGPPADRSAWEDQAPSVSAGELAYIQRDVKGAREIWLAVAQDEDATVEDRTEAYRQLARTSWRVYQNADEGIAYAEAARELDDADPANFATLSTAYSAAGMTDEAMAAARDAVSHATSPAERILAANAIAQAALDSVAGKRLDELASEDHMRLAAARNALAPLIANPPAQLETSALALAVAIRLDDGPSAFAAWASYYHSPTGVSAMADVHEAADVLRTALPRWTPQTTAEGDRRAIADALAKSFFFEEAALLLTDRRNDDVDRLLASADEAAIIAVAQFVSGMRAHTDEYYRAIAAANSNSSLFATLQTFQFRQGRKQLGRALWEGLGHTETYDQAALAAEAAERFALYYNEAPTSGVYDLHAGFTVLDTTYTATQYGRSANLRYVVVGRVISNGYESWLWDGRQQHGGWASNDTIYQVRPAYADGSLRRWNQLTDPAERLDQEDQLARLTADDPAVLGDAQVAYLPGLARRLHWQGINQVLEHARSVAGDDGAREEFTLELDAAVLDYSIFKHEGRHALDRQYADATVTDSTPEMEFRAKISQVVFSTWPRLTLGSILNPNMGDSTPHGIANQRLIEGVVNWMEAHADDIDGLNRAAPLLPQFDRLTDDQIRDAFRYQDPWAQEGV